MSFVSARRLMGHRALENVSQLSGLPLFMPVRNMAHARGAVRMSLSSCQRFS